MSADDGLLKRFAPLHSYLRGQDLSDFFVCGHQIADSIHKKNSADMVLTVLHV